MSNQVPTLDTAAGGQPAQSLTGPAAPDQKEYLTRDEALQLAKDAEEAAFKRAQSLIDKANAGVLKKVQGDLKSLEQAIDLQRKAGIQITDAQAETLKQQVINKAFTEVKIDEPEPVAPISQPPAQVGEPGDATQDPINAEAQRMAEEMGVALDPNDPEWGIVKTDGTPFQYLSTVQQALQAKKQRTAVNPQARLTTPTGGAPAGWTYKPGQGRQLIEEALKKQFGG